MSLLAISTVALSLAPRPPGPRLFRRARQQEPLLLLTPGFRGGLQPVLSLTRQEHNAVGHHHRPSQASQQTPHFLALY